MQLIPSQEEVIALLEETGALRKGHFIYPNGLHSDQSLQVPMAFRHYQHAKVLSVGLSRLIRANPEMRAIIPELSIVCPATGGLPAPVDVPNARSVGHAPDLLRDFGGLVVGREPTVVPPGVGPERDTQPVKALASFRF